jgi:hypothetical protein
MGGRGASSSVGKGHPDNTATQAARRLLAKRGIDWETGKKIKK